MIEINLVPDVKQELIRAQRTRSLVITGAIFTGVVAVGAVILLAVWVFGVQAVRQGVADGAIKSGDAKLQANTDLSKVLTIQNQLSALSGLNDGKTMYSRLFDVLASTIPPSPNDIQISDLAVDDASTTITIQGQAASGFTAVDLFKKTIAATNVTVGTGDNAQTLPLASNISTSDIALGQDATGNSVLRFTLSFVYPTELFSPTSTALKFTRANEGNVTDSYLDLPKSVFAQGATQGGGN